MEQTAAILNQLLELSKRGNQIQEQNVDYAIEMSMESNNDALLEIDSDLICHTVSGKPIKPKTLGQKQYVDAIRRNMSWDFCPAICRARSTRTCALSTMPSIRSWARKAL